MPTDQPIRVLILGASYGSLLAAKLMLAGHSSTLVCRPATAALINAEGVRVRMPVKGQASPVEVDSRRFPGRVDARAPAQVNPADYPLVVLAMQEPQYADPAVRRLLQAVAAARVPCLSLMNMPPLPYLARLPGVALQACRASYTDAGVWDGFDPALVALCSPDPQAVRPAGQPANVLEVRLATNFKSAPFGHGAHTDLLRRLEADIDAARHDAGTGAGAGPIELPVKLKVHDNVFVPLAKWSMLMAGNYRCVHADGMRPIERAVHGDLEASRGIYEWVAALCRQLGARDEDLVPFDKYAHAARSLVNPSSVARAVYGGAAHVERVDRLVQTIAAQRGLSHPVIDQTVSLIDARLADNRRQVA
ncbi:MAG: hypothetical protein JNL30_02335 [Rubrivivax sp.]|nr:hypothetical protein [Rubrivivax sp.]